METDDGFLWHVRLASQQCHKGIISPLEFAVKLSDQCAGDRAVQNASAPQVADLIPTSARELVQKQVEAALAWATCVSRSTWAVEVEARKKSRSGATRNRL